MTEHRNPEATNETWTDVPEGQGETHDPDESRTSGQGLGRTDQGPTWLSSDDDEDEANKARQEQGAGTSR